VNTHPSHLDQQRSFYEENAHDHLRPRANDHYSANLVSRLVQKLGIQSHHRVIEIGASFGRFTIPLLARCQSVVAIDLSARALSELVATRDELGVAESRCRVHVGDARELTLADVGEAADFVVGFFILHHLEDVPATITSLSHLVRAGGGVGFVEPNRRNPLFLAQVLGCSDMSWHDEKGMFSLSARGVCRAYADAGLDVEAVDRFGFFPPQLVNRYAWARRLETRVERARILEPLLPFLLMTAVAPDGASTTRVE
jgi:SAM-dependent methyltransferase